VLYEASNAVKAPLLACPVGNTRLQVDAATLAEVFHRVNAHPVFVTDYSGSPIDIPLLALLLFVATWGHGQPRRPVHAQPMPALDLERHVIPARQARNECRVSVPNEFDLVFEVTPPIVLRTRPATPRPSCTVRLGSTSRTTRLCSGYVLDVEKITARIHITFFYETAKPNTARYLCVRPIVAERLNRQLCLACHALC